MKQSDLSHLSKLQIAEFDIFKAFLKVCTDNNINYYMIGGSLLGCIRHKGFIPWDDDIDVAMTRKEYNKFLEHVTELPSSMYLSTFDTPGHIWLVPRIIDKNTRFYLNNAAEKKEIGAWIDILVIDGVPNPGTLKFRWFALQYLLGRMLYQFSNFSTAVNLHRKGRPWYEYAAIKFARLTHIEKILNPVKCGHFYDRICSQYDFDKCPIVAPLSGALQLKECVDKKWFGKGVTLTFEGLQVNGVEETDKYLTYIYGDYMTPPPLNERNRHNVTKVED